jgi:hypothetical protein
LPAEFSTSLQAQYPACCITSCTWIPSQLIQNHPLDVSRSIVMVGKQWFGIFVNRRRCFHHCDYQRCRDIHPRQHKVVLYVLGIEDMAPKRCPYCSTRKCIYLIKCLVRCNISFPIEIKLIIKLLILK